MTEETTTDFDKRLSYAWFAGLIDGEGWIGIQRNGYGPLQKKKSFGALAQYSYHPVVSVQMTHQDTVTKIGTITGYSRERRSRIKDDKHRPLYRWRVDDFDRARHVLEMVRPYVVTKKQQVEKVIEFIDNRKFKWKRGGWSIRPADDIEYCDGYYLLLRQLNLRGNGVISHNNLGG